jgi:hypothetical protein
MYRILIISFFSSTYYRYKDISGADIHDCQEHTTSLSYPFPMFFFYEKIGTIQIPRNVSSPDEYFFIEASESCVRVE